MARRKRQFLDDDSDSSPASDNDDFGGADIDENDPDAREERALFEDPYKRKRRRKNGKEDAIYGVFGSDDEDEGFGGRKGGRTEKRSDWTKAPTFVSKDTVKLDEEMDVDMAEEGDKDADDQDMEDDAEEGGDEDAAEEEDDDEEDESDESEPSRRASPRVREPEEDEEEVRPRFGGLGMGAAKAQSTSMFSASSEGGIGSSKPLPSHEPSKSPSSTPGPSDGVPTAFGSARTQRSFLRSGGSGIGTPKTPVQLSSTEQQHFNKLGGTFGARMLAKMGWQAGTGLGTEGAGIVTPVESKLRPKGMGLAFKGFQEKTEQSKAEARRRGEVVSDDEVKPPTRKGKKAQQAQAERSDAWKKPKKSKKKLEHKTYEQIIAEAGQEAPQAGIGQIIDATGATVCKLREYVMSTFLLICYVASRGLITCGCLDGVMDANR